MILDLWNSFGSDWRANCLAWQHLGVVIPPTGEGWQSRWTANPDILGSSLYYRGSGTQPDRPDEMHDRIAVADILSSGPEGIRLGEPRMIVDVGAPGEFDSADVLDPAVIEFKGRILVYYSAIGDGPDSVGLAISEDGGESYRKAGNVLVARAPEVFVESDKVKMLAQRLNGDSYELFLFESSDGEKFEQIGKSPAFAPEKGSWDGLSVVTFRHVGQQDGWHYVIYGGSADHADEPDFFGLARSQNLKDWERHPGNPIFGVGPRGTADGGAIWFPALLEKEDGWLMIYEGSEGRYSWSLLSQICGAHLSRKDQP
ncbi:hypothetical protein EON79_08400 [bacterium]|nr:MAG: hypothetical protein EON79_08400 [bacterium]